MAYVKPVEPEVARFNKWRWTVAFVAPALPVITMLGYDSFGGPTVVALIPLLMTFGLFPVVDLVVGCDHRNPSDELAGDPFYLRLAYFLIPAYYAAFFTSVWFATQIDVPLWAAVAAVAGVGAVNTGALNVGHELGHKTDHVNRMFAQLALSLPGFGHYTSEHNGGHHILVATPEDPGSARMGESIYAFAMREMPGTVQGGWKRQLHILKKRGRPWYHHSNEILQVNAVTLGVASVLVVLVGWSALPFIVLHHFCCWLGMSSASYVEHYGLMRRKKPNGRYEPCTPRHSWNATERWSNLLLLHLQRHSDHHAYPARPYQVLRDHVEAPVLPTGYPGCFVLAAIPPLWFRIMDPKVLAWADGDTESVNLCPSRADRFQKSARPNA